MNTTPSSPKSGGRKNKTFAKPAFAPVGTPAQTQSAAPAVAPVAPLAQAAAPAAVQPAGSVPAATPAAH